VFAIVLLIISTGGIAAYARGRGGNPYLWGTLSVAGFLLIQLGGAVILGLLGIVPDADSHWVILALSFAWVGVMAFCTRFLLGIGRAKPSGMWSCPNCKYLNQHYAVVCEACSQPYAAKP
jgi:hypothetical protein